MPQAREFMLDPACAICGNPATHVELRRTDDGWWFVYQGVVAGNGAGHLVSAEDAEVLTEAFTDPPRFDLMRSADLGYDNAGYCEECRLAYCYGHWAPTSGGFGRCPHGHGKGMDPHWSPD